MNPRFPQSAWLLTLLVMVAGACAFAAAPPGLVVREAWIRWLPANLPAGGYLTLVNNGEQAIVLIGASSPAYGAVQLHRTVTTGGLSKMQPVARVSVPAHSSLSFATQGYHLMLMKPRVSIAPGGSVPITLQFADGHSVTESFAVRSPNAGVSGAAGTSGSMPGMPGMPGRPH